jgi:hypothetical protein
MTDPNYDPLEGYESVPSVSFDPSKPEGIAEGTWQELGVTDFIKLVQDTDDKGKPLVYEDSGKPVMKFVLPVKLNGEDRALWGPVIRKYDTALFYQLVEAQKALRTQTGDEKRRIGPGVTIRVRWAWNTALPKKLGNHPKKYQVELVSVDTAPPIGADPLSGEESGKKAAGTPNVGGDPWATSSTSPAEPPF